MLLSEALSDPELVDLYSGLLASEARHRMLYVDMACTIVDREQVKKRLETIALCRAEILSEPRLCPECSNRHPLIESKVGALPTSGMN